MVICEAAFLILSGLSINRHTAVKSVYCINPYDSMLSLLREQIAETAYCNAV